MQCANCAAENSESAEFCLKCGSGLTLTCSQCGTELPLQARFCLACGASLAAQSSQPGQSPDGRNPSPEANAHYLQRLVPREYVERLQAAHGQVSRERRMVTILFCDVKGSTAMAEGLDPEDVMEIMDGAFDFLIEPVYRYEGTLARLMGDAILAFFGAPITHEDDPERACRAALDIVAGAQDYAARLGRERGVRGFNVRLGINTGLVVVGEVGSDLRVEYTAMGDAVNLAARLESAAEPGTVLISEATQKLIAPLFETEALGAIEIRGRAEPAAVYQVLATKEIPGKLRGIAGLESPLVGREADLAALTQALADLKAGAGGIVTLVGEAGIGKSRLVAELRKGATHLEGALHLKWVEGRCLSYGGSVAYLLWLDLLRGLLGVRAQDAPLEVKCALRKRIQALCPDRLDEIYPFLGWLLSLPLEHEVEVGLSRLDGPQLKAGAFRAAELLLASAAREGPLVLVCEDLHWADPTSMELLEGLLPLGEQVALLVVCIFRPVREHRCWRLREIAARDYARLHTDVWLDPLSVAESEALVGNLLWLERLPQDLRERILDRADGNPFYLEEVLRSLIDAGAIEQEAATGRWLATREVADIAIPDTLQGVLMARIDRLQEETKRVLQMASVIGRLFLCRVLAQLAYEERDLQGELQALQREDLVRERARRPDLEYIFKHELTREAAYNGLLKAERRTYHRQVAEALERLFPERFEEQVGLLAHHWERAGDAEKAAEYLLRAGDQARLAYAHEEAVDYYRRALVFLKEAGDDAQAARTLMCMGLTYDAVFDFKQSRKAYEEGFALWQRAGQTGHVASQPPPHALREAWGSPLTLDPGLAADESITLIEQLFSGLVDITREMGIVPDVAARWEISDGGRTVIFHLRNDVFWSDGVPVTAYDFEYAWKRVLDPATGSPAADLLYEIRGARAYHQGRVTGSDGVGVRGVNDDTLVVELEAPVGYLMYLLACSVAYPVPAHLLEQRGGAWAEPGNIVTNGPFTLKDWGRGRPMVLDRYPQYHGQFRGNVERVVLSDVESWPAAIEMYDADLLDIGALVADDPEEADRVRRRHAKEYIAQPEAKTIYLVFDVTRAPFDDLRVRRAFAYAVDREALASVVSGDFRAPATGGLVPPGMPGHAAGIALPHDAQRGRLLLAAAGYPAGEGFPDVEWLVPGGFRVRAPALQVQWRQNLGVEIRWQQPSWAEFTDRTRGDPPQMSVVGWLPDYPDPDNYLRAAVQRHTTWRHEPYLALVEQARRTLDQAERMALYAQAEQILVEQVPLLPLSYGQLHELIKPWVKGYATSAAGSVFWKDVVLEPH